MKIIFRVQVHSNFSALSVPGDRFLYYEATSEKEALEVQEELFVQLHPLQIKTVEAVLAYSKPEEFQVWDYEEMFYYNIGLGQGRISISKEEMDAHIKPLLRLDFTEEKPRVLAHALSIERAEIEQIEKDAGFVFWMDHSVRRTLEPSIFQGALDKDLWNRPIIQTYVSDNNSVHGYLGHGSRRYSGDKHLCEKWISTFGDSPRSLDILAAWMCSKSARHFMDQAHYDNERMEKERISNSLDTIYEEGRENLSAMRKFVRTAQ